MSTSRAKKSKSATGLANKKPKASAENHKRAMKVLKRLLKEFPQAGTELHHENPFQLLVATILSAQCTDERVNKVTPELFRRYPTPESFARANPVELEEEIRSTGFYRMKTKNIIACSKGLVERHSGKVPPDMEALVLLPGVGRKTANVVLGQAFGIASGVVVDTHVHRLARRLGFTAADDPIRIEQDLMLLFPRTQWINIGSVLILHGRRTCVARNPKCLLCAVADLCPSAESFIQKMKH